MYSIHTHFGYTSLTDDIQLIAILALSVPIQAMLGSKWVKQCRREKLVEEDTIESKIQMVEVVIQHYDRCLEDGCVCG